MRTGCTLSSAPEVEPSGHTPGEVPMLTPTAAVRALLHALLGRVVHLHVGVAVELPDGVVQEAVHVGEHLGHVELRPLQPPVALHGLDPHRPQLASVQVVDRAGVLRHVGDHARRPRSDLTGRQMAGATPLLVERLHPVHDRLHVHGLLCHR